MPKGSGTDMSTPLNELRGRRPSRTVAGRFKELGALALDLVERRLLDGTASAAETCWILQENSRAHELDMEYKAAQTRAHHAKADSIEAAQRTEETYLAAIAAMQRYAGDGPPEEEPVYYGL